jgi:hypothetical protein
MQIWLTYSMHNARKGMRSGGELSDRDCLNRRVYCKNFNKAIGVCIRFQETLVISINTLGARMIVRKCAQIAQRKHTMYSSLALDTNKLLSSRN